MYRKHLSSRKIASIIRCFCANITAFSTVAIVGEHRNTINSDYRMFREAIFYQSLKEYSLEAGEFKLDESYFGAKQVRGQ